MREKSGQNNSKKDEEMLVDLRIEMARVNQDIEKANKDFIAAELKAILDVLYVKKRSLRSKISVLKLEKVARRDQIKAISDQILGLADVRSQPVSLQQLTHSSLLSCLIGRLLNTSELSQRETRAV